MLIAATPDGRARRIALMAATALLVTGTASASPPVALSDVAAGTGGFVMHGIAAGDQAGLSVSGAGDVNGDGLDDLIVGAPYANPGGPHDGAGQSYVVFGRAETTPIDLAAVAAGVGGFAINGSFFDVHSGLSVSGAGDVNGDGLDDLIVGAPDATILGPDPLAGEAYVVFGKASTTPVSLESVALGNGGFVIRGKSAYDGAGVSVSGAGDVNGDGLADVIIGASGADPGGLAFAGESSVVFGRATTTPVDLGVPGFGFTIIGAHAGDGSGGSVSGAGDVNGDGLADVIVGAIGADPGGRFFAGASFVVFGRATTTDVDLGVPGFGIAILGAAAYDRSGWSVSGAGDVNGDGLDDVVIGARTAAPGGAVNAGAGYVVFGTASTATIELADVAAGAGGFVMTGIGAGDLCGHSVSGAGDVNDDGLDDVIIGAPNAAGGGTPYAGESFVVYGRTSTAPVDLAVIASGAGGFVISGIDMGDSSGTSVSGAGDVNGDGVADVVIGAKHASPGGQFGAGESFAVFGPGPAPPCPTDLGGDGATGFADLNAVLGAWGPCAGCAQDLNGDGSVGFADLNEVLGAWGPCG